MLKDEPQISTFLREISLFSSLDEQQIDWIAGQFILDKRRADETIFVQGQRSDSFYIILQGQAAIERQISATERQTEVYVSGDFFGEDSLLQNKPEPASAIALTPMTLLRLKRADFMQLVDEFPVVRDQLHRFIKSHRYHQMLHFDWLNEDEVVYQIRRRHIAALIISLVFPCLIGGIGFGIAAFTLLGMGIAFFSSFLLIISAAFMGIGIGWGIWKWIDWGNDYYVITNQRAAWLEKVIWLYESRIEAPMNTILSINITTSFIGRIFGFGDVILTTYTGKVLLETVNDPDQLSALITEYWHRFRQEKERSNHKVLQQKVRQMLGEKEDQAEYHLPEGAKTISDDNTPDEPQEPSLWEKYFGNIFKLRVESGAVITYRKHWLVLLKKTLLPGFITLGVLSFIFIFDIMHTLGRDWVGSPLLVTLLGGLIIITVLLPWWFYHYLDWRNDIYQVTDRSIFDIERKPFGTESKKSAPLDNILSLEHKRPGFLGYIFNVGFVTINVGEAKLTFEHVFQPARVQQDIFNRMHALRLQKQKDDEERQRSRMLELLEIYHDEVERQH